MTSAQRTHTGRFRNSQALALLAVLGIGASLTACGPQNTPPTPEASSASPSATATASSTEGTPSSAPTAAPSTSASTPAATPLCTAAFLTGSLDDSGGGAAGHIFMKLIVANSSGADCILDGYPGVSMVQAGSITPIGAPAERDPQAPSNGPITLAPGQSAAAVLRYTQAGNYQDCQQVQADSVLVYPPSATDSLAIPHALTACSNDAIKLLSIGAFQP
ncbi:DUF4232 domain-containing protein [Arthrobacter glacialis]|uniref:DUF4232 domain-containing protein n=1 Tax=Arthrobacter glacialis TaxID=1664 RepID=UPI000CD3E224|nr:DUF4232 domain-containing protein [Arthrobacter glacialis]POH61215.1 hypothetical protein CVS28_01590 [Arthrobacter glacialis]